VTREGSNGSGALSAQRQALLEQLLHGDARTSAVSRIPRRPSGDTAPLSFAQQRLWFLDQLVPDSPFYNILNAIRLHHPVNPAILDASIREIVRRHEVLRSRVVVRGGEPVQVVADDVDVRLRVVDLRAEPPATSEAEAARIADAEVRTPFDLASGPLLRAVLVQLDEARSVFVVTMHHIVSDGWSMGLFFRELNALYEAFALGRPSPLQELAVQYADYAVWQRSQVGDGLKERQVAYWREQLADLPALELPLDRPRAAVQTFRGSYLRIDVDAALGDRLRALSRAEGVTLFMTLLAGFKALLHRYSGQVDLALGSPIAGRNRTELEPLIGFFVNTLVLRTRFSRDSTFRELLHEVQSTALAAYAHQELPFEMLVEELHPERDLSRNPMFQAMFQVLAAAPGQGGQSPSGDEAAEPPIEVAPGTAKFELTVTLTDYGGPLAGSIEYNTDLFDEATIASLVRRYLLLLDAVASAPDTPLAEVSILEPGERERLLEWNATARDYPRNRPVRDLFAEQAALTPDAVAVRDGERALSYGELGAAARSLARVLVERGAEPGEPVGILLPRSLDQLVATLAVLDAGGVYLPLDPSYPQERIAAMLADAGARLVVTRSGLDGVVGGTPCAIVLLGDEVMPMRTYAHRRHPETDQAAADDVGGESTAYVMYTSGSTGMPKGIAVPDRAIARLVRNTDYLRLGPGDRVAHASNCSFDAATFEIWGALLNGAELVVVPRETTLDFRALADFLRRERVDVLFVTTALFNQIAHHVPSAFAGVRDLLFGGEAADPDAVREVLAHGRPVRLVHVYGPTESTTFASWYEVNEVSPAAATVPIGKPVANTTLHVLDERLRPVPPGVPGGLFIGGDGLALGYVGRPALTAERFVADPFGPPGSRLYATGDVARRLRDGNVEFLGRRDGQVKVRGFRVELGEIEAVLDRRPDVRDTVVVLREDRPGEKRLVAYVVGDDQPEPSELRAFLRDRLPEYMVPSAFVRLDALPLSPNGKVDRNALPRPTAERAVDGGSFVPAQSPHEQLLAEIWRDVLHLERVGIHDNFFDLGGHSLLMAKVHNRLVEAVAQKVTMIDLFQFPTIASLARHLDGLGVVAIPELPEPVAVGSLRPESPRSRVEDRVARQRDAIARRAARRRRDRGTDG
jgi:amino acid adenylation domain-containing protein